MNVIGNSYVGRHFLVTHRDAVNRRPGYSTDVSGLQRRHRIGCTQRDRIAASSLHKYGVGLGWGGTNFNPIQVRRRFDQLVFGKDYLLTDLEPGNRHYPGRIHRLTKCRQ